MPLGKQDWEKALLQQKAAASMIKSKYFIGSGLKKVISLLTKEIRKQAESQPIEKQCIWETDFIPC